MSNIDFNRKIVSLYNRASNKIENIYWGNDKYEKIIFLSGFPRSGTTFLFEVITRITNYRPIFEPMHYNVPDSNVFRKYGERFENENEVKYQYFPYLEGNTSYTDEREYMHNIIRGHVDHPRVDRYRSITDFAKKGTIIKCVRSNLMIKWFYRFFNSECILIVRHPCAIVESARRQSWGWWLFSPSFLDLFVSQSKLLEKYIRPRWGLVKDCHSDPLARLAFGICLCIEVPLNELDGIDKFNRVIYEDIVCGNSTFEDVMRRIDISKTVNEEEISTDRLSSSTQGYRKEVDSLDRCFGWRDDLSNSEVKRIYEIIYRFPKTRNIVEHIDGIEARYAS